MVTFLSTNTSNNFSHVTGFFRQGTFGKTPRKEDMRKWMPEFVDDVRSNTSMLREKADRLERMAEKERRRKEVIQAMIDAYSGIFGNIGFGFLGG